MNGSLMLNNFQAGLGYLDSAAEDATVGKLHGV